MPARRLGERLQYSRPTKIRELIEKPEIHAELLSYGTVPQIGEPYQSGNGTQREVEEYWLNEAQCLIICMMSRTDVAPSVRREVVTVFLAYRHGDLVPLSDKHVIITLPVYEQMVARENAQDFAIANHENRISTIEKVIESGGNIVRPAAFAAIGIENDSIIIDRTRQTLQDHAGRCGKSLDEFCSYYRLSVEIVADSLKHALNGGECKWSRYASKIGVKDESGVIFTPLKFSINVLDLMDWDRLNPREGHYFWNMGWISRHFNRAKQERNEKEFTRWLDKKAEGQRDSEEKARKEAAKIADKKRKEHAKVLAAASKEIEKRECAIQREKDWLSNSLFSRLA